MPVTALFSRKLRWAMLLRPDRRFLLQICIQLRLDR